MKRRRNMESWKEDCRWVEDLFKNNQIQLALEHDTIAKKIFEGSDEETKIHYFFELFMGSLIVFPAMKLPKLMGMGEACQICGQTIVYEYDVATYQLRDYVRDAQTRKLERGRCETMEDYSFEVSFPTGRLICRDALPYLDEVLIERQTHTLNSQIGIKERTLAYAKQHVCQVFVGNSSPHLFKKEDTLIIGHSKNNEDDPCACGQEGCGCEYEEYPPIENAIKLTTIWTDFWWTTLVDESICQNLLTKASGGAQARECLKDITPLSMLIKPGVYQVNVVVNQEQTENPSIYATLEWIREIAPHLEAGSENSWESL